MNIMKLNGYVQIPRFLLFCLMKNSEIFSTSFMVAVLVTHCECNKVIGVILTIFIYIIIGVN